MRSVREKIWTKTEFALSPEDNTRRSRRLGMLLRAIKEARGICNRSSENTNDTCARGHVFSARRFVSRDDARLSARVYVILPTPLHIAYGKFEIFFWVPSGLDPRKWFLGVLGLPNHLSYRWSSRERATVTNDTLSVRIARGGERKRREEGENGRGEHLPLSISLLSLVYSVRSILPIPTFTASSRASTRVSMEMQSLVPLYLPKPIISREREWTLGAIREADCCCCFSII
ncbi:unnamed protein product [Trichogramma brassicae]|uniref:Uncharacterized protein n=1 Tax=Trichogramma brassicae TaxID=86971 RepID=A0A6H5J5G0_9HYME|nr:unnamed protein product [Trichogramma brassicae]